MGAGVSRIILAATLAAATLVGWFLLSIARLARQLELSGTAGPSQRDASQYDDSEVVGMPTTWVWSVLDDATIDAINAGLREASVGMTKPWRSPIDWDGILSGAVVPDHGRMN